MGTDQILPLGESKKVLDKVKCFALDMDGTFYLGNQLIPGALEFIERVEKTGRKFVFLTNNSSKNKNIYLKKLAKMGVYIKPEQLITSGHATIAYLKKNFPGRRIFLMGNEMLSQEFSQEGILLSENEPEVVVTAFDTSLTYEKLCQVCDLVRKGLPFIATHPDFNCPTETGFIPDIGAMHALIEASTGRMPDKIIGKPNREIVDYTLEQTGSSAGQTAMVGDRLYTDIATGAKHGLISILVLSGETVLSDLSESQIRPTLIFNSLADMVPLL